MHLHLTFNAPVGALVVDAMRDRDGLGTSLGDVLAGLAGQGECWGIWKFWHSLFSHLIYCSTR